MNISFESKDCKISFRFFADYVMNQVVFNEFIAGKNYINLRLSNSEAEKEIETLKKDSRFTIIY